MRIWQYTFLVILYPLLVGIDACYSQDRHGPGYSFDEIAGRLEQTHDVVIFYNPEWFAGQHFVMPDLQAALVEAMQEVLRGTGFSTEFFDGSVAIVPDGPGTVGVAQAGDNVITIGDPLQLGRQRFATISGQVVDGNTGEPLFGAVIYSEQLGSGVSAGIDGAFSFRLPVGEHRLRISYVGYQESSWQVLLASDGDAGFELFQQATALDPFTLTATRAEEHVTSVKMGMVYLDAKTLRELPGAFGERDIVRSMTMLPGVQTMGEFGTGFHVRGGSADQNLVLLEGVPLFHTSHLFGLVSIVNPDMVSNVTLMKAGIPASYGERASAVLDIRKSGNIPEAAKVQGGIGLLNSRIHAETPLFNKKAAVSIGGRSSYSNWLLQRIPDVDLMNSEASFYDLSAVITTQAGKFGNMTLFAYQSADEFLYGGATAHDYFNQVASARWNVMITPSLYSRLSYGISRYGNTTLNESKERPMDAYKLQNDLSYQTIKWQLEYEHQQDLKFEMGVQAIHYEVDPGGIDPVGEESIFRPFRLPHEQAMEYAAYISSSINFSPRLGMELGLRGVQYQMPGPGQSFRYDESLPRIPENIVDTITYGPDDTILDQMALEPRLGLRYLLDENSSLKISLGRHHQFIQLVSNTAVMTPSDIWKLSKIHHGAMRSDQLALGYFRNFNDHTIETSLEAYYKKQSGMLDYRDGARILLNPSLETDLVAASGFSYGMELFLHKKSGRLTGWLGYTFSASMRRTNETFESHMVNDNKVYPASFDKPHNLIINSNYHISRRWRFNATFTYNTGRPATYPEVSYNYQGHQAIYYSDRNKYRLPDYHRLDLAISFDENLRVNRRGKGSWTFSLINVYGRKNPFSVFYEKSVPHENNDYRNYSLYKLYIIGRPLPVITYNFAF
jgi:hypothetical protein